VGVEPTFFVGGRKETETQNENMAATPSRIAEITSELEAVAQGVGCELVHAELKGGVLRLFVDKPEGVTLADCEQVSRQASALLDVLDFGSGRYVLEVSSPGLDRQLYKPRDYERFAGRLVRVTYEDPETGKKRTDVARLQGLRRAEGEPEESARVLLEDGRTGEVRELPLNNVKLARLEIEL
jgi:ribosome maturation factor RimP